MTKIASCLRDIRTKECVRPLQTIADTASAPARARRLAREGMDLARGVPVVEPQVSDEEFQEGLQLTDDRGKPSDWHIVSDYAQLALQRGGRTTKPVFDALVCAMGHDQTYVRVPVAKALGYCPDSAARQALLRELVTGFAPFEVRQACLDALNQQLSRAGSPRGRQLLRSLMLTGARIASTRGYVAVQEALVELCRLGEDTGWYSDQRAIEVLDPLSLGATGYDLELEVRQSNDFPPVIDTMLLLTDDEKSRLGPDREPKFRIAQLKPVSAGRIACTITDTTWRIGRAFHALSLQDPGRIYAQLGRAYEPIPLGIDAIPGILATHVVSRRMTEAFW